MTVDVGLLAVLALPLSYLFTLVQLGLWWRQPERRSHLRWALVNLLSALGATLLVARTLVPLWVTTSLANTLLIAAMFAQWSAMAQFGGRRVPLRWFAVITILFFVLFQGLWGLNGDLGLRVLLASAVSAILNGCIAYELLRAQQTMRLRARAFLSTVFALHALFFLFRSATAVTLDASMDFLQAGGIQNLTVTIAALKLIAWNLGAVWMVREQLSTR